jgi:hypothetical protein
MGLSLSQSFGPRDLIIDLTLSLSTGTLVVRALIVEYNRFPLGFAKIPNLPFNILTIGTAYKQIP